MNVIFQKTNFQYFLLEIKFILKKTKNENYFFILKTNEL